MVRKTLISTLAVLALAAIALPGVAEDKAMSADDVIANNLAARGGADKIAAIKSARIQGTMLMGPGAEAPFTLEWMRPDKMRLEFTVQGMTGIQAYDGTTAWVFMPFAGQTEPQELPADAAKQVTDMADFDGPLVNYKDKGNTVEYLGLKDVEGTSAHAIKLTKKNGDVVTLYLDADAMLEIKAVTQATMSGQELEVSTSYGDYKEVGGMMMAHSMEIMAPGAPAAQVITMDKIELNVDVDEARFAMPAPAPAPAEGR